MNRDDFLRELRSRIGHLPTEELEAAMAYYREYFDECGDDAAAWAELGSPAEAAARIIADYEERNHSMPTQQYSRKGCLPGFLVGVFATVSSPVWVPLIIVVLVLVFVFLLLTVVLLFVLAAVGFALLTAAAKVLFISIPTAIFSVGAGLLLLGTVLLAAFGIVYAVAAVIKRLAQKKGV